uniref:Ig-like domain-containing protein n=1 Tax=Sander lucioperca TaxID=283035 RepID=A0A8C9XH08_SANLU
RLSQCLLREQRNMASSFLRVSLFKLFFSSSDGFIEYYLDHCDFNSSDLKDIEYIRSLYYNKVEYARFSSSLGKYVGYTEYGLKQADYFNSQASILAGLRATKETVCNTTLIMPTVERHQSEATISLLWFTELYGALWCKHSAMLVCSVYDFYPKQIRVKWTRDGQEVTSDVTSTDELADGDWYYQIHSHLEYTPR